MASRDFHYSKHSGGVNTPGSIELELTLLSCRQQDVERDHQIQQAEFDRQLNEIARMTINPNEIRKEFLENARRQETADFERRMQKIADKRQRLFRERVENTNSPMREEYEKAERDFQRNHPDGYRRRDY